MIRLWGNKRFKGTIGWPKRANNSELNALAPVFIKDWRPNKRSSNVQIECNLERSNTRLVCKYAKLRDAIHRRNERRSVGRKCTLGLR